MSGGASFHHFKFLRETSSAPDVTSQEDAVEMMRGEKKGVGGRGGGVADTS